MFKYLNIICPVCGQTVNKIDLDPDDPRINYCPEFDTEVITLCLICGSFLKLNSKLGFEWIPREELEKLPIEQRTMLNKAFEYYQSLQRSKGSTSKPIDMEAFLEEHWLTGKSFQLRGHNFCVVDKSIVRAAVPGINYTLDCRPGCCTIPNGIRIQGTAAGLQDFLKPILDIEEG